MGDYLILIGYLIFLQIFEHCAYIFKLDFLFTRPQLYIITIFIKN
jgi:hypothetical protein